MTTSIFKNVSVGTFIPAVEAEEMLIANTSPRDIYEAPTPALEEEVLVDAERLLALGDSITIRETFAALEDTVELTPNDLSFLSAMESFAGEDPIEDAQKELGTPPKLLGDVRDSSVIERMVLKAWKFLLNLLSKIKRLITNLMRNASSKVKVLPQLLKKVKEDDRDDYRVSSSHLFAVGTGIVRDGVIEVDVNDCNEITTNLSQAWHKAVTVKEVGSNVLTGFSSVKEVDDPEEMAQHVVAKITPAVLDSGQVSKMVKMSTWHLGVGYTWSEDLEEPFTSNVVSPLSNPMQLQLSKAEMIQVIEGLILFSKGLDLPQYDRELGELISLTSKYRTKGGAYSPKFHGAMISFSREYYVKYVGRLASNLNQYIRIVEAATN